MKIINKLFLKESEKILSDNQEIISEDTPID